MLSTISLNWKAGVTVSLVSIPLSIALAVASGMPPTAGIVTAIWAGLLASLFGGSNFNIVGPTGALSGVIASYVIINGGTALPTLTVLVGIIIFISYLLRLERYLVLIPASVIHGFTLGVALIIGLGQINAAVGLSDLPAHEKFIANFFESVIHLSHLSWSTASIFALFLMSLLAFKKFAPRVPGAIVMAPIGIGLGYLTSTSYLTLSLETLESKFGAMPFQLFSVPTFSFSFGMVEAALVIALIAILETMLSAKIADAMTKTKYHERKEMLGLSLANIASGIAGGMPATAALARTSLNIKSGATSRVSGIISVISIVLISLFLLSYFRYMPMVVIAAILVYVAIQMVEAEHFLKLYAYEKSGLMVSLLVAVLVVVEDPVVGILVGVAVSLLIYVNRISKGLYEMREDVLAPPPLITDAHAKALIENSNVLLYSFKGRVTYINAKAHLSRFEANLAKYKVIILRFREVDYLDLDGIETIDEIIGVCKARGQQVILTSVPDDILGLLQDASFYFKSLKDQSLVFPKTEAALMYLHIPLREYRTTPSLSIAATQCSNDIRV